MRAQLVKITPGALQMFHLFCPGLTFCSRWFRHTHTRSRTTAVLGKTHQRPSKPHDYTVLCEAGAPPRRWQLLIQYRESQRCHFTQPPRQRMSLCHVPSHPLIKEARWPARDRAELNRSLSAGCLRGKNQPIPKVNVACNCCVSAIMANRRLLPGWPSA